MHHQVHLSPIPPRSLVVMDCVRYDAGSKFAIRFITPTTMTSPRTTSSRCPRIRCIATLQHRQYNCLVIDLGTFTRLWLFIDEIYRCIRTWKDVGTAAQLGGGNGVNGVVFYVEPPPIFVTRAFETFVK